MVISPNADVVSLKLHNTPMDAEVTSMLLEPQKRDKKANRASQLGPELSEAPSRPYLAKQATSKNLASNDDLRRMSKTGHAEDLSGGALDRLMPLRLEAQESLPRKWDDDAADEAASDNMGKEKEHG